MRLCKTCGIVVGKYQLFCPEHKRLNKKIRDKRGHTTEQGKINKLASDRAYYWRNKEEILYKLQRRYKLKKFLKQYNV